MNGLSRMVQWTSAIERCFSFSPSVSLPHTQFRLRCVCASEEISPNLSSFFGALNYRDQRFLITKTHRGTQLGGVRSTSHAAKYRVGVGFELLLAIRSNFEDIFVFLSFHNFTRTLHPISPKFLSTLHCCRENFNPGAWYDFLLHWRLIFLSLFLLFLLGREIAHKQDVSLH